MKQKRIQNSDGRQVEKKATSRPVRKKTSEDTGMGKLNIRDMVQALTKGKPFVFVIMSYHRDFAIFEKIKRIVESEEPLVCIRADDVGCSGHDLREKIHHLISRAEVVIAEVSERTPNVYYELGYAVGIDAKPMLLISGKHKLPTDLEGLEVIRYRQTKEGMTVFEKDLRTHILGRLASRISLFRDMLQAPEPHPAYILASPKYPTKNSRIMGQVYDGRTFGDQLGILGLLSIFGLLWGERSGVELVSAQHAPPDLLERPYNVYLIGSDKSNPHTAEVLKWIQGRGAVSWHFDPLSGYTRQDEDWPCVLYKQTHTGRKAVRGKQKRVGKSRQKIWVEDYGIIIRAPHPKYANRMAVILAGGHSLGTGAACLAVTRSELLQKVKNVLPEDTIEDKKSSFWVLVKGVVTLDGDKLLDPEGVTVEEAGVFT